MKNYNTITIAGINWATEDFVIPEDTIMSDGTIMKRGKKYFTWLEAVALEREGKLPEGMRLPTFGEFIKLYKNACRAEIRYFFQPEGRILSQNADKSNGMDIYNNDPENVPHGIISTTFSYNGGYWSNTKDCYEDDSALALFAENYGGGKCIRGKGQYEGLCIRCVEGNASTANREMSSMQKTKLWFAKKVGKIVLKSKYSLAVSERFDIKRLCYADLDCEKCPRFKELKEQMPELSE